MGSRGNVERPNDIAIKDSETLSGEGKDAISIGRKKGRAESENYPIKNERECARESPSDQSGSISSKYRTPAKDELVPDEDSVDVPTGVAQKTRTSRQASRNHAKQKNQGQ